LCLFEELPKFERSQSFTSEGVGRYRRHLPAAHSDVGVEETEGLYCSKGAHFEHLLERMIDRHCSV
uniref:E3 ubiquitin-protein ligase n=1 Tax=Heligmosomoides polygyrus TaxID=6339 RepID=A0A183G614_HELPZ